MVKHVAQPSIPLHLAGLAAQDLRAIRQERAAAQAIRCFEV